MSQHPTNAPAERKEAPKKDAQSSIDESRNKAAELALQADARLNAPDVPVDEAESINISGHVAEKAGENRDQTADPSASGSQTQQDDDQDEEVKVEEMKIPQMRVMVRKVKSQVKKEIHVAEKQVKKYSRNPSKYAFQLSQAVTLLRKLQNLLEMIIHHSGEFVKKLWISMSQGKKISEVA